MVVVTHKDTCTDAPPDVKFAVAGPVQSGPAERKADTPDIAGIGIDVNASTIIADLMSVDIAFYGGITRPERGRTIETSVPVNVPDALRSERKFVAVTACPDRPRTTPISVPVILRELF